MTLPLVITYVYEKQQQKGTVLVNYEDEEGNSIADQESFTDVVGTEYTATKKTIEGYDFLKMKEGSAPATGTIGEEQQIVTFVYKKVPPPEKPSKPDPTAPVASPDSPTPPASLAPKTGDHSTLDLYFGLLAISFALLGIALLRPTEKGKE
jgi:uncharacterized surface anchored protein